MADVKSSKSETRAYRSPRRQAQAAATRVAIVEAAHRRFVADGYGGTTIEAIAADAEVSAATVYASFGSKRAVLSAVVDATVVGEGPDVPLVETDWVKELKRIPNAGERFRAIFAGLRPVYERTAAIDRVLGEAASTDPEIAQFVAEIRRRQLTDAAVFRSLAVGDNVIFPGLTPEQDTEAIAALTGTAVFRRLVGECGWSPEQWESWVVELSERLVSTMQDRR